MSTNVQNLRDLKRWNVFEFKDNKYVPVFPFAGTWQEMEGLRVSWSLTRFRLYWPNACPELVSVILPYGCSF